MSQNIMIHDSLKIITKNYSKLSAMEKIEYRIIF
jgi:hypothetical protein